MSVFSVMIEGLFGRPEHMEKTSAAADCDAHMPPHCLCSLNRDYLEY